MSADPLPPRETARHTKTTFLALPRELRQKILRESLDIDSLGDPWSSFHKNLVHDDNSACHWSAKLHNGHPGIKEDVDYVVNTRMKVVLEAWLMGARDVLAFRWGRLAVYKFDNRYWEREDLIDRFEEAMEGLRNGSNWCQVTSWARKS